MKKRNLIIILILVLIIVIVSIVLVKRNNTFTKTGSELEQKGYNIFGKDYCTINHSLEIGGDALTEWNCKLCGTAKVNSNTNVPKLCQNCAIETGRCNQCGKLKK